MIERHLAQILVREAEKMPVVTLMGPRQSGKTTLVRAVFGSHAYFSLERPDIRAAARSDPVGFLSGINRNVILDEVQRAPELLSYIQADVDEDDRPGRFILTGSQNLLLMEGVSQTLAGRTSLLHLLPFSLTELRSQEALRAESLQQVRPGDVPSKDVWEQVWTGFYPRIHDRKLDPMSWLADYFRTYVERDLRDVLRVMDLDTFERFVRLCAARTGTEVNLSSLASDAGVSQPTARSWLTALRTGWIVTLLPPHHANFRKRLRKRPKIHFLDTGLACYLLGIHTPHQLANHPLRGALFESFVVSEILKSFEHRKLDPPLFYWRDATGHEVDLIIDSGGKLVPVEIKSAATFTPSALDGLRWWAGIPTNPNKGGVLVYGGAQGRSFNGFTVLPWFLL